ncbi:hypothetical protein HKD37_17G048272 [Glycine soja]
MNNVIEEETRKRPRLNWGEGLAKLEKKKTEGDGVSVAIVSTPTSAACSSFSVVAGNLGQRRVTRHPKSSQIGPSFDNNRIEKMKPLSSNLHGMHETTKENDINSPGIETPKFLEANR